MPGGFLYEIVVALMAAVLPLPKLSAVCPLAGVLEGVVEMAVNQQEQQHCQVAAGEGA